MGTQVVEIWAHKPHPIAYQSLVLGWEYKLQEFGSELRRTVVPTLGNPKERFAFVHNYYLKVKLVNIISSFRIQGCMKLRSFTVEAVPRLTGVSRMSVADFLKCVKYS